MPCSLAHSHWPCGYTQYGHVQPSRQLPQSGSKGRSIAQKLRVRSLQDRKARCGEFQRVGALQSHSLFGMRLSHDTIAGYCLSTSARLREAILLSAIEPSVPLNRLSYRTAPNPSDSAASRVLTALAGARSLRLRSLADIVGHAHATSSSMAVNAAERIGLDALDGESLWRKRPRSGKVGRPP